MNEIAQKSALNQIATADDDESILTTSKAALPIVTKNS
jgi:hypothetical protein